MCCMFTCCGWMVDLVQRFWTFTMSCCISSAICCMLITASMSGVALGYNYSLAEYMDLKETNVSIFMKRGIFDDEIADVEFRRSGNLPRNGQLEESNLRQASDEVTSLRSGRRFDDSVFETGDQHRYEGDLMRLTAKPPYSSSTMASITDDLEMANIATAYAKDSLDSLKAIQSVIDARKSMANRLAGGTTVSHVPTYPFNEPERLYHNAAGGRRLMPNVDYRAPRMNPARLAVPDGSIGSRLNWQAPKRPEVFQKARRPSLRPSPTTPTPGRDAIFISRTQSFTLFSTASVSAATEPLNVESFKERLMLDNEMIPRKIPKPKSDEEYDYDIKGLPVRKRRSIELNTLLKNKQYRSEDIFNPIDKFDDKEVIHSIDTIYTLLKNPMPQKEALDSQAFNKIQRKELPKGYNRKNMNKPMGNNKKKF